VIPSEDARKRGTEVLQQAADARAQILASDIARIQAAGATTLQAIADGLNDRGIPAARGGKWSAAAGEASVGEVVT
jgi:hypothetical protein